MGDRRLIVVEDVLTETQLRQVVKRCVGKSSWQLVGCSLRPACEGLAGFGGDHFRMTLRVRTGDEVLTYPLFVKTVPIDNPASLNFVEENMLFAREITVFKLIEEMETGQHPWAPQALFCSESVVVQPDLATEGYAVCNQLETLDLQHVQVTLASLARFHAAIANYESRRSRALRRPYSLMEDHGEVIVETMFKDTPWVRAGAKLTSNIIQQLSKYRGIGIPNLESKVLRQFLAGFGDLTESASLNVVLHRDLWVKNIMFKYENGVPINAMLIDFQCVRYGPPAFDIMMLLCLTTSRSFRKQHEGTVLRHYFKIFMESLDIETKLRLKILGYDYEDFLRWIDLARRFGIVAALMIFPSTLMDSETASRLYGDPDTYDQLVNVDRTAVVLAHAARCPEYAQRQIELTEEFVERYILPQCASGADVGAGRPAGEAVRRPC